MKTIPFDKLKGNATQLIGQQWMLVTAGQLGAKPDGTAGFNTMTASWGGFGFMWNKPVVFVVVRPNRHTDLFIQESPLFTLSFMPSAYRGDLGVCGKLSGRDGDKLAKTSLRPYSTELGSVAFEDADIVLECRPIMEQAYDQSSFRDWSEVSPAWYTDDNPLHKLYIAEVVGCHIREEV